MEMNVNIKKLSLVLLVCAVGSAFAGEPRGS